MSGKRKGKRRWLDRLRKTPHLFSKIIITHCIIVVTAAAYWSLFAQYRGANMTDLFIAIGAVFISELAMLLLKTIFKKEGVEDENSPTEPHI